MEYFWPSRNFESVRQRLDPSLRGVLLASVRPSLILGRGRIGQINPTTKSGQTYMTASKFGCLSVCQSVCRPQRKSSLGGWAVRIVLLAVRLGGLLSLVSPALQAGRQTAALPLPPPHQKKERRSGKRSWGKKSVGSLDNKVKNGKLSDPVSRGRFQHGFGERVMTISVSETGVFFHFYFWATVLSREDRFSA